MRRGPKSTPTALLLLEGGKRRGGHNLQEPLPDLDIPEMPEWLPAYAKLEWAFIVPHLARLKIITVIDHAAISAYCVAFGRWRLAEEKLTAYDKPGDPTAGMLVKTKGGNVIQNPMLGIANAARRDAVRAAAELGLTPAARAQIAADRDPDDEISKRFNL